MFDLGVTVNGLQALQDALGAVPVAIDAFLPAICLESADAEQPILEAATPRSRVRHPHMQDRWFTQPEHGGALLGDPAPYGPFLITGTRRMRPNAALRRAWEEAPDHIAADLEARAIVHLSRP